MRLFTAIRLSYESEQVVRAVQQTLKRQIRCKRWQPLSNLHLTLHFLGEINEERVPQLDAKLRADTEKTAPFQLETGELGVFPDVKRARVLWLGIKGEIEKLQKLQKSGADSLQEFGCENTNKSYIPHITLARELELPFDFKEASRVIQQVPSAAWTVDRMVLFRSELTSAGAVHTALHEYPLSFHL